MFIIYLSLKRNSIFERNYAGTFDVSCNMFSDDISLVLRDSNINSENISLIQLSISDGQKTCNAKSVSLIGIY